MNENISFYKTAEDRIGAVVPLVGVLSAIAKGRWKEQVEKLRAMDKAEYDQKKKYLPAAVFSSTLTRRTKDIDCVVTYNSIIILDFDHIDVAETVVKVEKDKFIMACFVSPSGAGLKILVRTNNTAEHHSDAWHRLYWYFLKKYELKADPSGKDLSRLCFISYDPNIIINKKSITFEVSKKKREVIKEAGKIYEVCKKWSDQSFPVSDWNSPGNRNNHVHHLACNLRDCGIDENVAMSQIFDDVGVPDPKDEKGYIASIHSAYKKTGKVITLYEKAQVEIFSDNVAEDEMIKDALTLLRCKVPNDLIYQLLELRRDSLLHNDMSAEEMGLSGSWLRNTLNKAHKIAVETQKGKVGSKRLKTVENLLPGLYSNSGGVVISTCIPEFDDILDGGFRKGNVIGLIGREGTGKSIYSLLLATESAKRGTAVAIWNGEMSTLQAVGRVVKKEIGRNIVKELEGKVLDEQGMGQITKDVMAILQHNLYIISESSFSADDIVEHVETVKEAHGKDIGLVIIDGISQMEDSQNNEIYSAIKNGMMLKEAAKKANVAIVVLIHTKSGNSKHFRNQHDLVRGGMKMTANLDCFISTSLCIDSLETEFDNEDIKYIPNTFYLRLIDKRESGKLCNKIIETLDPLKIVLSDRKPESFEVNVQVKRR